MKLSVPYYSQFIDIQDPFWMLRACGACSLKDVAEFHGKTVPDIVTLCNEAKERGGYDTENGWVHDYIVTKLQELGLRAERKEGIENLDEVFSSLDAGNPVIVSVEKRVLEQTRFHMIVLVGYETISSPQSLTPSTYFYYHESESTDKEKGQYRSCTKEQFLDFWRGKAIFVSTVSLGA
ncbi:MAG: hypothetical protein QG653_274 [Patescibacteria group bacterium]|nr:hypothetical protein [Patescibacteria group bacterium]